MDGWLSAVFLGELAPERHEELVRVSDLEARLAAMLDAGRGALPTVALDAADFLRHVAALIDESEGAAEDILHTLHVVDLYLACACGHGDPAAITLVADDYISALVSPLRATGLDVQAAEDVLQRVREILLVGADGVPGIVRYRGSGPLRSWLRAVAVRQAMTHLRRRPHDGAGDDGLEQVAISTAHPELGPWKQQYASAFHAAFEHAVKALSEHDRTLLRQHHLDQLTVDELAALHKVHRATAARWVAAARNALLALIRKQMQETLGISGGELDSALRLARSQLHVSVHRLLGGTARRK